MSLDVLMFKQMLIPIVAIVFGLGMPALVVFLVLHFQHRRQQLLMDTVRQLADRGQPIPRELLDPPRREQGSPQFRAITLVGVGIGLALMFWWQDLAFLMGIGGLLLCIGAAQLIALRLEPRTPRDAPAAASGR